VERAHLSSDPAGPTRRHKQSCPAIYSLPGMTGDDNDYFLNQTFQKLLNPRSVELPIP
jgi:hypothetical protein